MQHLGSNSKLLALLLLLVCAFTAAFVPAPQLRHTAGAFQTSQFDTGPPPFKLQRRTTPVGLDSHPTPNPLKPPPPTASTAGTVRSRSVRMMGAGGAQKVNGEELEKELSDPATPVLLDVYAQVRNRKRGQG